MRVGAPNTSRDVCERSIEVINECLAEGFPLQAPNGRMRSAITEAANRIGIAQQTLRHRLGVAERIYDLKPDPARFVAKVQPAPFTIDELPEDGEPSAEELIAHLKARYAQRKAHEDAKRLMGVQVNIDGPLGLVFFGDPHVDSNGTDWPALERDVALCRDTPGILAVSVGDARDNWVGRLMALYANQEVTAKQSLTLIEWLFTQLPWLLTVGGNHDKWHSEGGDAAEVIHRLRKCAGLYENDGARLKLNLPSGAAFNVHVRHDFPGSSVFNGAHAFVRETLFGFRDHILACGHRHASAYQPIWHNDPERLCHGFRCGSYKVIDTFAKEKHFKSENWAKSIAAVVNPDYAHDPVRYIMPFFSVEEAAEYLTWRRAKWGAQKSAA